MPSVGIWGLIAAAAAALLAGSVAGARRPAAPVPDVEKYFRRWAPLHGDLDPRGSRLISGWLRLTYRLARPLAVRGVSPNALTGWGVLLGAVALACAAMGGRGPLIGAVVVVASALLDGLDGAVAVLTGRATRFGYVLDSLADRTVDAGYLVALWLAGAPAAWCVAGAGGLALLEYTRARAGNAGMGEIAVVTIGERPTRVILAALGLGAAGLSPAHAGALAGAAAAATAGVTAVGLGQLLVAVRRALAEAR
ncbi:MAG: CDP-alcohol phosphatidyltransferase family protein [Actinomycetota bacterium]|nr:CDP-alcohol phosphatidyltransferase family protein [Actinomycetota bacterium]